MRKATRKLDPAPRSDRAAPSAPPTSAPSEVAAEYVPIDSITPWAANPRANAEAVKEVARSIRRFGFASPIIARRANGEIIAGHTRYLAAKRLRLERVPVRFLDISEQEAHALALADNKIGEIASWDNEVLGKVLAELQADDVDLDIGMGFTDREIEKLVAADVDSERKSKKKDNDDASERVGGLTYRLVVDCTGEEDQALLLERLEAEGRTCRPLMS